MTYDEIVKRLREWCADGATFTRPVAPAEVLGLAEKIETEAEGEQELRDLEKEHLISLVIHLDQRNDSLVKSLGRLTTTTPKPVRPSLMEFFGLDERAELFVNIEVKQPKAAAAPKSSPIGPEHHWGLKVPRPCPAGD